MPDNEYDVELDDAEYDKLLVTMDSEILPSLGGFVDAVRGTDSDELFWTAIGRHARTLGLHVAHKDATGSGIAMVTLRAWGGPPV